MGELPVRELIERALAVGAAVLIVFALLRSRSRGKALNKRLPPGPKPWPILGNLGNLEQVTHQGFAKMSQEYGSPLIHLWLGSVHLIVAHSINTAKEILQVQDLNFASRPIATQFELVSYENQTISACPHGPVWRHLRKVLVLELLTLRRIQKFQPLRAKEVKAAIRTLLEESNGEKAVTVIFQVKQHLTNILTQMIMSKSYFGPEAVGSVDAEKFQSGIQAIIDCLGIFHLGDYIPLFKYWDVQGNKKKMRAAHEMFDQFLQAAIDERRQKLASNRNNGDSELQEKGDFLDALLTRSVVDDDIEVTDDRMKGILQDTIGAGTDSPAATVEWALAELMRHPHMLKKAQEELDAVVGKERLVEEEDIARLPYIQAIAKEALRLHPVTPMLLPHVAGEACEIEGYYIPAGSQVLVNYWAIGRDPNVWENPLDFDPERFVDSAIDVAGLDFELLPFGAGRRKCPGMNLGFLEVQHILAALIQCCEWSFPPGQTPADFDMSEGVGIVNHRANPLQAVVTPRVPMHILAPTAA